MILSLNSYGQLKQKFSSLADPSVGRLWISEAVNNDVVNAEALQMGKLIRLNIPVANGGTKDLPAGSCKIKIGLGSKLQLDPSFSLNEVRLNQYFKWTAVTLGGQQQITGELVQPLPADFHSIPVYFRVNAIREGNSTITVNFLVSNHYTENTLSDVDPTNNTAYLQYSIKQGPKISFTSLDVNKTGCTINVAFTTSSDANVVRYEIESSKDKVSYVKVGEATARNMVYYNNFELTGDIKASTIYVRVKMVKNDGSYTYSDAKAVGGSCEQPWVLSLYPNPVTDTRTVTVTAKQGVFNGKYKVSIVDAGGKQAQVKEVELNYVSQFKYDLGVLGAGQYMLQITNTDGTQSTVLKFEKL